VVLDILIFNLAAVYWLKNSSIVFSVNAKLLEKA
jgi:hypothetical protein